MTGVLQLIKIALCTASFILLCTAAMKINLNRTDRAKQFLMPVVALVYSVIALIFLNQIYSEVIRVIQFMGGIIPAVSRLNLQKYLVYLVNVQMAAGFLVVKAIVLPILKRIWERSEALTEFTSGRCYEYDKELDKWFVKPEYGQIKFYCKGIYYSAVAVSSIVFVLSQYYPQMPAFQTSFYPIFGLIVLGEIVCFLSGLTKSEFIEDILGEDEESYKVANYGLLRDVLKNLFGNHVLYDATMDNGIGMPATFETLEELCESKVAVDSNLGHYFRALKESGREIEPSYVKSCIKLVKGRSVLFCNPFYRDLTDYLMVPMTRNLMKNRKSLIIMGRDSAVEDVVQWLNEGIVEQINTDSLWKVEVLNTAVTNADIGILKFSDLFNFEIQQRNS